MYMYLQGKHHLTCVFILGLVTMIWMKIKTMTGMKTNKHIPKYNLHKKKNDNLQSAESIRDVSQVKCMLSSLA